jgi:hypothetical protein
VAQLQIRLLQRAAHQLGGLDEVALYLSVPDARLRIWMRGVMVLPDDIFLKLVDLISEPSATSPAHVRECHGSGNAPALGPRKRS